LNKEIEEKQNSINKLSNENNTSLAELSEKEETLKKLQSDLKKREDNLKKLTTGSSNTATMLKKLEQQEHSYKEEIKLV